MEQISSQPVMSVNTTLFEYVAYNRFTVTLDNVLYPILFTFCIFGFIGSVLTFATLYRNKSFSEPCFICYQAIAVSEICYLLFKSPYYLYQTNKVVYGKDYLWYWSRVVGSNYVTSIFAFYNIFLACFLSLQRAVACFLPTKFSYINNRGLCIAVTIITFLAMVALHSPSAILRQVFWNETEKRYVYEDSPIKISVKYKAYSSFIDHYYRVGLAVTVVVTSALAIAGMLKAAMFR